MGAAEAGDLAPAAARVSRAMGLRRGAWASRRQQDAHEFLLDLMDAWDSAAKALARAGGKENAAPEAAAAKAARAAPPSEELFGIRTTCSLKCESCGFERSFEEKLLDLSLDLPEAAAPAAPPAAPVALSALLDGYFAPETICLDCEKCDGTRATQTRRIAALPKVLALHLKRFRVVRRQEPQTPSPEAVAPSRARTCLL